MSQKKNNTKLLIGPGKHEAKNDPGKPKNRTLSDNSDAESQKEDMVETTLVQPINIKSNYNPFFSSVGSKSSWFQDLKGFLCLRRSQEGCSSDLRTCSARGKPLSIPEVWGRSLPKLLEKFFLIIQQGSACFLESSEVLLLVLWIQQRTKTDKRFLSLEVYISLRHRKYLI